MPIATARGWRSSWPGACAILIRRPRPLLGSRLAGLGVGLPPPCASPLLELRLARLPLLVRLPIGLRLPLPLGLGLGDGHPDPTERLVEGQHALGVGLLDGERSDFRPPQRDAVPSERIGDRPDVRARS